MFRLDVAFIQRSMIFPESNRFPDSVKRRGLPSDQARSGVAPLHTGPATA